MGFETGTGGNQEESPFNNIGRTNREMIHPYCSVADELSADIKVKSKEFAEFVKQRWNEVKPLFKYNPDTEMFEMPWDKFDTDFRKKLYKPMSTLISTDHRRKMMKELKVLRAERTTVPETFQILEDIVDHDIMHLSPRYWLQECMYHFTVSNDNNERVIRLPKDWMEFYEEAINDSEKLTNILALVVDYSKQVIENSVEQKVEEKPFKLVDTFTNIARIIKGRFAWLDFDLLVNPTPKELEKLHRNRIVLIVDPELELKASESFIFADIYNLVKNSTKAIEEKTRKEIEQLKSKTDLNVELDKMALLNQVSKIDELDDELDYRLLGKEIPIKPNQIVISANLSEDSIVLTVDDTGVGLSLDDAMSKIIQAMNIATQVNTDLETSSWFNAVLALGFSREAELLLAWSKGDHKAYRFLTIGAILGMQHIRGYQADDWKLRSITGGLGLLSANYLAGELGGKLLATNKYNGGAFFTLSLPKASVGLIEEKIESIW